MNKLISIKEACNITSLSRTSLWMKIKSEDFPKPVCLGGIRKAFLSSEVEAWISARVAERDSAAR